MGGACSSLCPLAAESNSQGNFKEPLSARHHLKITQLDGLEESSQAAIWSLEISSSGPQIYTCYHGNYAIYHIHRKIFCS